MSSVLSDWGDESTQSSKLTSTRQQVLAQDYERSSLWEYSSNRGVSLTSNMAFFSLYL